MATGHLAPIGQLEGCLPVAVIVRERVSHSRDPHSLSSYLLLHFEFFLLLSGGRRFFPPRFLSRAESCVCGRPEATANHAGAM